MTSLTKLFLSIVKAKDNNWAINVDSYKKVRIDDIAGAAFFYNKDSYQPIWFSYSLCVLKNIAENDGGIVFTNDEILFFFV